MKQRMQNSYEKGLAICLGPESCAATARDTVKRRQHSTALGAVTGDRNLAGGGGFESLQLDEVRQAKADSPLVLSAR
jgi:hypothetical protein